MATLKKVSDAVVYVGANDRRIAIFEGVYRLNRGVSYNSYVVLDEKTALMDTVDRAVSGKFMENVRAALGERPLDYLVVQHMEPDHSATISDVLSAFPAAKLVVNSKIATMLKEYLPDTDVESRFLVVKEGDVLPLGEHKLHFIAAPMVHWPEVMVTYEEKEKILFSADAFGSFGALSGALFLDEADEPGYFDEARRYYTNIVGKYGTQVQALLKKAATVQIDTICPLHGYVVRKNIADFVEKYQLWSSYTPEKQGALIAYASVYGHTAEVAEDLAALLSARGIANAVYDVSVTDADEIISQAFRYSHLVFASTTYNAGIFVKMENLLIDLAHHNLQNRKIALIENGSWAPTAGNLMKGVLSSLKNTEFLGQTLTVRAALSEGQAADLEALADAIAASFPKEEVAQPVTTAVDPQAFFKFSYGLFVLSVKSGERDTGCIINTAGMLTENPRRVSFAVNKSNFTHDVLQKTGKCTLSVLSEETSFSVIEKFGFVSGKDTDKYAAYPAAPRAENGVRYLDFCSSAAFSLTVAESHDYGTHTLFVCDVTEARVLSSAAPATYEYYREHIKPKPQKAEEGKKGFVCKVCGYVYEGETLPADFICPLCKHGAEDFEPLK